MTSVVQPVKCGPKEMIQRVHRALRLRGETIPSHVFGQSTGWGYRKIRGLTYGSSLYDVSCTTPQAWAEVRRAVRARDKNDRGHVFGHFLLGGRGSLAEAGSPNPPLPGRNGQ